MIIRPVLPLLVFQVLSYCTWICTCMTAITLFFNRCCCFIAIMVWLCKTPVYAQQAPVSRWHAYYTIQYKGNIPVDENGNPTDDGIDTAYNILAELLPADTSHLQFSKIFLRQQWWAVGKRTITEKQLTIGYDREQNKAINISPASGRIFIQLCVSPLPGNKEAAVAPKDGLLVVGKWKGRQKEWSIASLKALPAIYYP